VLTSEVREGPRLRLCAILNVVSPFRVVGVTLFCAVAMVTWAIPAVANGKPHWPAQSKNFSKIEAYCHDLRHTQPNARVGDPIVASAIFKKSISMSRQRNFLTTLSQAVGLCLEDTEIIGSSPALFAVVGSRSDKSRYEAFVVWYLRRAGLFSSVSGGQGNFPNIQ
jgi:hypothetical protein